VGNKTILSQESCAPVSRPTALVERSLVHITTPPDASGAFSSGTGIVVDPGWVLTNEHVIDAAANGSVRINFANVDQATGDVVDYRGPLSVGKVIAADPSLDLAILQADTGFYPAVVWGDEGKLQRGAPLIAVGFALGESVSSISVGRFIDATVDRSTGQAFIESDVPLLHGESGGPMLNRCGQVVGINTARIGPNPTQSVGLSIPAFGARRWAERNRPQ
jgi:S1-C subfamily serine protease